LLKVRVLERGWRKKGEIQSEIPLEIVMAAINGPKAKKLRAGKGNFPLLA